MPTSACFDAFKLCKSISGNFNIRTIAVIGKLIGFYRNAYLENFVGDGLLVSTSFGSTAYNLSFGGSIIYNTLHTLQITPIAPFNPKSFKNLLNPIVIPQNSIISIVPEVEKRNLIVTVDGENIFYEDVTLIETFVKDRRVNCLREKDYNFIDKVNDKFVK